MTTLVLDDLPVTQTLRFHHSPLRDRIFEYLGRALVTPQDVATTAQIKQGMGVAKCEQIHAPLRALRARGLVHRYFVSGKPRSHAWSMTSKGLELWHQLHESTTVAKPKARKPRRTGSPKRVPHKPTAAHKKPTRQQRRESDRRREHEDRVTL